MSFKEWLFSSYPNPSTSNQWGLGHIASLVLIALFVVISTILLKKRSAKDKRLVLIVLASLILFFEIARRVINFCKTPGQDLIQSLRTLLPRPGCAIACWLVMIAVYVNKKIVYNVASIISILCGGIFFIYPVAGYNNQYIMFSNLYSIVTHMLLLVTSISLITLKFTDFKYKGFWKLGVGYILTFIYGLLEIFVLKTFADPMYFMPGGDIQANILGIDWGIYIVLYFVVMLIYVNSFYLIADKEAVMKLFKKNKKEEI